MKCFQCAAEAQEQETNHIVDLGNCIIIVRRVPSYVCPHCGEVMYTAPVAKRLEQYVSMAKATMNELSVIDFRDLRSA